MKSKSEGKGDNRFIKVWKIDGAKKPQIAPEALKTLPPNLIPTAFQHGYVKVKPSVRPSRPFRTCGPDPNLGPNPTLPFPASDPSRNLPAFSHREQIVKAVRDHQVTLISGSTGCGKSTQVPKYIYHAVPNCNMVITQPRRISATSIASRLRSEMSDTAGVVGHHVRLDRSVTGATRVKLVTPAILIQELSRVGAYTHVVVDEVHEREVFTEFLLISLREVRMARGPL